MRIALIVPGGVDPSGEYRVIPALLALIRRLAQEHDLNVFSLYQSHQPARWQFAGATIHSLGALPARYSGPHALLREHWRQPFEVFHAFFSGHCGLLAVGAGRLLRRPSLVHVGGGELVALPEIGYGSALRWSGRTRERLVLRGASRVTAASHPTLEALRALGVSPQRVVLGVDVSEWLTSGPAPRRAGVPARLLHIASLNRVKDQPTLLRALQRLKARGVAFHMQIVGEDTLHGAVQRLAVELDLSDRVEFVGFLTQAQLRPNVAAAHVLVHSSRHETGPLAVLEAAACAVPTVGTAVGHIAEWAPQAAVAVPVGDWCALADAIEGLLADEPRRLALGYAAQQRAITDNADQTAAAFSALYREVA